MSKRSAVHTNRLIRQNSMYLAAFVLFVGIFIYILTVQVRAYNEYKNKIPTLTQEVAELALKKEVIYSFDPDETDRLISTLNTLLPNTEDYFSIITSLDTLSRETGFEIGSYTLSVAEGQTGKVTLHIEIAGSTSAFEDFLEYYPYKSGRLLTIDKIEYSLTGSKANISLNFYSKNVVIADPAKLPALNQQTLNTVKKINQDIESLSESSPVAPNVSTDYTGKENPFEL